MKHAFTLHTFNKDKPRGSPSNKSTNPEEEVQEEEKQGVEEEKPLQLALELFAVARVVKGHK